MKLVVRVRRQDGTKDRYEITETAYIGRASHYQNELNTIVDDHESVSRRHAKLTISSNKAVLMDCGSSNGTRLNDQIIESGKYYKLKEGDIITLADSTTSIKVVELTDTKSESESSRSRSRSRDNRDTKVSESTKKMLEGLEKYKSKYEKIRFLKLMGHKNAEGYLKELEESSKGKATKVNFYKANQYIERQFEQGRKGPTKRGIGS